VDDAGHVRQARWCKRFCRRLLSAGSVKPVQSSSWSRAFLLLLVCMHVSIWLSIPGVHAAYSPREELLQLIAQLSPLLIDIGRTKRRRIEGYKICVMQFAYCPPKKHSISTYLPTYNYLICYGVGEIKATVCHPPRPILEPRS
jgi:hypothetical protein